jgi:ribosomal-protein-alanine N-acetyltransferase
MHSFLSHPEVAVWLRPQGVVGPFTPDECEAWARRDAAHWAAHGFGPWLAWDDDVCVGRSALKHTVVAGRGEVEIGWAVARAYWGRGVATLLGRHALAAAAELELRDVVAFTRVDNLASRRVMARLGLTCEREFTYTGLPHVLYRTLVAPTAPTAPGTP